MADDKLRDLTPVDIGYIPGERPTDEKLEGAEVQTKNALEYIEATIGDAFGESLQTDLMYISNISRDIGDRSAMNPVLLPSKTISNYIQSLTLGEMEHELDLIPTGSGAGMISSSGDTSVVPGQYKSTVAELTVTGDWTILPGKTEGGIQKNSRKLVTHAPSSGGTITFAQVTSGRGSAYEGARHNVIPSIAQAQAGGPFINVSVSDAVNNIYTIQLPQEELVVDNVYDSTNATLSNTKSSVGTNQQMRLPSWMFDVAGLDMGADEAGGGPKVFPLNSIKIYDWIEKRVVPGLLEVKASSTPANRQWEISCTFRSDIILDDVSGQYLLVTNGTSIAEMIGALQRDVYFHTHMGDDMIRGIKHSDLFGLRTGSTTSSDRSAFYGPSNIDNSDHSMYLHRDGYVASDTGGGGNVMRGSIIVGNTNLGPSGSHEHYNLIDDSYSISFGELDNGGKIYFDKVRQHNIPEGRGNIPTSFSDNALVIRGSRDNGSGTLDTTYVDGNLRVSKDVVLGTSISDDVIISGDIYVKNSMILIPRTVSGLTPETGMMIYSSTENAPIFWNGSSWVNANSAGFGVIVGDGVISFGKFNGTGAATIQSAIDQVAAQGGGKVKVLRGNYSYGATAVVIKSGVIVEGEGAGTKVTSTATAFRFQAGSDKAGLRDISITTTDTGAEVNGTNHELGGLNIINAQNGITLSAGTTGSRIDSDIRYTNVTTRINSLSTSSTNLVERSKPSNFANGFYLVDYTNKPSLLDKWKKISGAGTLSFNSGGDSRYGGPGNWQISGVGAWVFEDYMPVSPSVGVGGYIHMNSTDTDNISVGFEAYNENLALIGERNFVVSNINVPTSWSYYQDIAVLEGSGTKQFPPGTRFIRLIVRSNSNSGLVFFDGVQIHPMNFATISLYS